MPTIAVTGTNGKTTTTTMLASVARAWGRPSFLMTTLGAWVGDQPHELGADWASFDALGELACAQGIDLATLEVTSRALANGFADRWPPDVAVFTGLSRDHLDRHGTPEAYLAAKARLFLALRADGAAVLPVADEPSDLIVSALEAVPSRDGGARRVLRFGLQAASLPEADRARFGSTAECALRGEIHSSTLGATCIGLEGMGFGEAPLTLQTTGTAFAFDAVAAALGALAFGVPESAIRAGLENFEGVPGRFTIVAHDPAIVVDFAHTPDALRSLLLAARRFTRGRVLLVFGCGGGRDPGKRPQMGAIASELADEVWLTTDNPRHEDPAEIAAQVRAGQQQRDEDRNAGRPLARWHEEANRQAAIEFAVNAAGQDDFVVVAGKGHETVQIFGELEVPFDDKMVARAAFDRRA